ncbi:MAG: hypothetical protein E6I62_05060 [Chloroflexi bacterium]|nr:MAG: hypothetical protein E6I62_05060 [Chloroflexota bacterium]
MTLSPRLGSIDPELLHRLHRWPPSWAAAWREGAGHGRQEETMQLRRGAVATSAGTLALVLLGGPMLGSQALAAGPSVISGR